jgi:hypothetical protein
MHCKGRRAVSVGLILTLFLVASFTGCTGFRDSKNPKYLLPVLDANGHPSLQEFHLKTLHSPYSADGDVARIYFDANFANGFSGSLAAPRLVRSGDTFIPRDPSSGMVLAIYMQFERLYFFEQRVLINSSMTWPRTIGIFQNIENADQLEANAMYIPSPVDVYGFLPVHEDSMTALALNAGIIGHEHFHAHFDRLVNNPLKAVIEMTQEEVVRSQKCPTSRLHYQIVLMRAWNEGLADFYGAMFSGMSNFIAYSAPAKARPLDVLPDEPIMTAKTLRARLQINQENQSLGVCTTMDPYVNGKQLARVLYAIAARDEFPKIQEDGKSFSRWERGARFVLYRLREMGQTLNQTNFDTIETYFPLSFLLAGVPLSPASCMYAAAAIGNKNRTREELPQCNSFFF